MWLAEEKGRGLLALPHLQKSGLQRGFVASVPNQQEPEGAGGGKGVRALPNPFLPSTEGWDPLQGGKRMEKSWEEAQNLKQEQLNYLRPPPTHPSGHRTTAKASLEECTKTPSINPPIDKTSCWPSPGKGEGLTQKAD